METVIFDIAIISNNITSHDVICHLAGNVLKEQWESVINTAPCLHSRGASMVLRSYCYKCLRQAMNSVKTVRKEFDIIPLNSAAKVPEDMLQSSGL